MWRWASVVLLAVVTGCSGKPDSLRDVAQRCRDDAELSCARPILNVRNLKASFRYYESALGFRVDWEDDAGDFGSVSRGDTTIFLCEGCQGTPGAWLMTFSPDVDALHREFVQARAKIRMPPRDMPWGVREMHVADLDGNVLRIGTGDE